MEQAWVTTPEPRIGIEKKKERINGAAAVPTATRVEKKKTHTGPARLQARINEYIEIIENDPDKKDTFEIHIKNEDDVSSDEVQDEVSAAWHAGLKRTVYILPDGKRLGE